MCTCVVIKGKLDRSGLFPSMWFWELTSVGHQASTSTLPPEPSVWPQFLVLKMIIMYVDMCMCTHACTLVCSCAMTYSGGQRIKCASCFFPSTMWELGITLKSSGLVAIAFAH